MKKIFIAVAAIMLSVSAFSQAPEKMSYQAVVRNATNTLVVNQSVGMQITILQGGATGTAVYVETQTPTTNANGLVSLEIGLGTVTTGDFSTIDWGNDSYYIKTETDPTGGSTYTIEGTTQLMSVPYALYAKTSGSATGPAGIDGIDGADGAQGPAGNDGADGVDGAANISGTTNHLVKFTNATTGGDSKVYDDGTNVGVNNTNPQSVLDVNGILTVRKVASQSTIQTNENDAKMLFKTNRSFTTNIAFEFADGANTPLLQIRDNGQVGIGTIPAAQLDIDGDIKITDGTEGNGKVLTSDANGLATWTTPITTVTAGTGLTGGGTTGDVTLDVVGTNGITATADDLKLGGTLTETTTINSDDFSLNVNLNGTGTFNVRDNGVVHFQVKDDGETNIGGNTTWRQTSTAGTEIATLNADGNDGRFAINENGTESIILDANGVSVFNEQGLDRNFRVESVGNVNMLRVDASSNRVGIGTATPTSMLEVEGNIELAGGLQAPAAEETLKILRANVSFAGVLTDGQGITVTNPSTGIYEIVYITPFISKPTVTFTALSVTNDKRVVITTSGMGGITIKILDASGALINGTFNMIAIGPR
jgi:hypothetical protein